VNPIWELGCFSLLPEIDLLASDPYSGNEEGVLLPDRCEAFRGYRSRPHSSPHSRGSIDSVIPLLGTSFQHSRSATHPIPEENFRLEVSPLELPFSPFDSEGEPPGRLPLTSLSLWFFLSLPATPYNWVHWSLRDWPTIPSSPEGSATVFHVFFATL